MRVCEWCSAPIGQDRKGHAKTCSEECGRSRHLENQRAWQKQRYVLRPKRVQTCDHCGVDYTPARPGGKFCSRRCQWNAKTLASRPRVRPCSKCGVDTPTRPGTPVCPGCRVDRRDPAKARATEQRRRLRAYGLTQSQYDALLVAQGGGCAICQTDRPGIKGWAIDHCHETGAVRGLLCSTHNLGLGQFADDPALLRAAADYIERARETAAAA